MEKPTIPPTQKNTQRSKTMSTYSLINQKLEETNKTWNDLCEHLGLPAQYAYNWRAGGNRSYMHRLEGITKYLNVSVKELKKAADQGEKGVVQREAVKRRNAEGKPTAKKAAQAETKPATKSARKSAAKTGPISAPREETRPEPRPATTPEPTPEELMAEMQGIFMSLSHEAQIVLVNSAKLMGKL